jgi:hypothetical protein
MTRVRQNLLLWVLVTAAVAIAAGFLFLFSTDAALAWKRLIIDLGMLVALGTAVWWVLGPLHDQLDELSALLRGYAGGDRHARVQVEQFGAVADLARAANEVGAAMSDALDTNLGPVRTRQREAAEAAALAAREQEQRAQARPPTPVPIRPPWNGGEPIARTPSRGSHDDDNASHHPELGEVRKRPKVTAEPEPSPELEPAPAQLQQAEAQTTIIDIAVPERADVPRTAQELRALFDDFVAQKNAHTKDGEGDVDLDFDAFAETIAAETSRLMAAHSCRGVRFEVLVADGDVSLRPRLLR